MLVDANLLLYSVHEKSEHHEAAVEWLTEKLNGPQRVGLPWSSLGAFLRIATHPRAFPLPLSPQVAWDRVNDWLAAPASWIPAPGSSHAQIVGELISRYDIRGNLVPDALFAALAIEHGLTVCSADADFARFDEVRWENPLR